MGYLSIDFFPEHIRVNLSLTLAIDLGNAWLSGLRLLGCSLEGSLVSCDHGEGVSWVHVNADRSLTTLVSGVCHKSAAWFWWWVTWASAIDMGFHWLYFLNIQCLLWSKIFWGIGFFFMSRRSFSSGLKMLSLFNIQTWKLTLKKVFNRAECVRNYIKDI